jgi:anti-sigma factor RsiW
VSAHLGEQLSALVDGHLDAGAAAAARAHLASCPACARELEVIAATRSWLRGLPSIDAPSGFYERILVRHRRRIPLGLAALTAAAAASVALATMPTRSHTVKPAIPPLVEDHVVSASLIDDPVALLTAVAVSTTTVVTQP